MKKIDPKAALEFLKASGVETDELNKMLDQMTKKLFCATVLVHFTQDGEPQTGTQTFHFITDDLIRSAAAESLRIQDYWLRRDPNAEATIVFREVEAEVMFDVLKAIAMQELNTLDTNQRLTVHLPIKDTIDEEFPDIIVDNEQ